jgi:hypothetical protein
MQGVRGVESVDLFNLKSPDRAPDVFKLFKKNNPRAVKGDYLEFGEYFHIRLKADGTWVLLRV